MVKNKYEDSPRYRTNYQIRSNFITIVDEENHMLGKFPREKAIEMAQNQNLDLVEINFGKDTSVARICDYSKFLYSQKKKAKLQKKNVQKLHTIQIHLGTEKNDLNHKFKQIRKFLADGDPVKFTITLIGREMEFKGQAFALMQNCLNELSDVAQADSNPKMTGKVLEVTLKRKSEKI